MAYAAIPSLEEFRDEGRAEVRQRLHDRFDRWLQRVEDHVKELQPTRVTQVNRGKSTPGTDQVVVTTVEERGALCTQLSHLERHMVHRSVGVYIPKW